MQVGLDDVEASIPDCPAEAALAGFLAESIADSSTFDFIYVLESGSVSVLKSWLGKQYKIRHLGPGDCFGEMALIDLSPRSASIVAVSDCSAIALPPDSVHQLYERDLEQFALIQMNMARELSRRLRVADERIFSFRMGEPFSDSDVAEIRRVAERCLTFRRGEWRPLASLNALESRLSNQLSSPSALYVP